MQKGPHRRHRLVRLRPRRTNDLPSSPLDRRTRDKRRSLRGLGPVRVRPGRAPDHRRDQAATNTLGHCDGSRLWLGPLMKEPCGDPNRLLIRTASNAYFPQTMSVISLPDKNEAIAKAIDQVWEHYLQFVEDLEELIKERERKPPVKAALEGLADEEVFAEIQSRKGGQTPGSEKSVKQAEFETLVTSKEEIGADHPDGTSTLVTYPPANGRQPGLSHW